MYQLGILVAILLHIYEVFRLKALKNSLLERNLNKVGKTINDNGFSIVDKVHKDTPSLSYRIFKFIINIITTIFLVLLSWLWVAVIIAIKLYYYNKDSGVPKQVKEFRWRMKNIDMSTEEVEQEINNLERIYSKPSVPTDK